MTLAGSRPLDGCPICVNLNELGVFGLHGDQPDVAAMCSSVLIQAVTLHSPEDLVLVVIEGRDTGLGTWAKWLPHTRSATSPLAGRTSSRADGRRRHRPRARRVARTRTGSGRPGRSAVAVDPRRDRRDRRRRPGARVAAPRAVPGGRHVRGRRRRARRPRPAAGQGHAPLRPVARGALSTVWFTEPRRRPSSSSRSPPMPGSSTRSPCRSRRSVTRPRPAPPRRSRGSSRCSRCSGPSCPRRCRSPRSGRNRSRTGCGRRSAWARPARSCSTSSSTVPTPSSVARAAPARASCSSRSSPR